MNMNKDAVDIITENKPDCERALKWKEAITSYILLQRNAWEEHVLGNFVSSWRHLQGKNSKSEFYVTTDSQSNSLSWCQAPIWGPRPEFY
jgi:hypothetical protein